MTVSIVLLVLVVVGALVFEYINGFHDAANAIATVVSTKVLTPRQAVVYGATLEFTGALTGTHVAKTIGAGILQLRFTLYSVRFVRQLYGTLSPGFSVYRQAHLMH